MLIFKYWKYFATSVSIHILLFRDQPLAALFPFSYYFLPKCYWWVDFFAAFSCREFPSLCGLLHPFSIFVSSPWHSNSSFTPTLFASESSSRSSTFRLSISVPQKYVSFIYVDSILRLLFYFVLWHEHFNITAPPPLAPAFSWCRLSGRGPPRFAIWPAWPAPLCALSPGSFSMPSSLPSWAGRSCWPAAWRRRQPSSCSHGFLWAHRWLLQLNLHTCIALIRIIVLASSALDTFIIILLLEDVLQPMEPFLVFQVIRQIRSSPFCCC